MPICRLRSKTGHEIGSQFQNTCSAIKIGKLPVQANTQRASREGYKLLCVVKTWFHIHTYILPAHFKLRPPTQWTLDHTDCQNNARLEMPTWYDSKPRPSPCQTTLIHVVKRGCVIKYRKLKDHVAHWTVRQLIGVHAPSLQVHGRSSCLVVVVTWVGLSSMWTDQSVRRHLRSPHLHRRCQFRRSQSINLQQFHPNLVSNHPMHLHLLGHKNLQGLQNRLWHVEFEPWLKRVLQSNLSHQRVE